MSIDKYTFKKNVPKKDRRCLNMYGWIINKLQDHYNKYVQPEVKENTVKEYTEKQFVEKWPLTEEGWQVK